MFMPMVSNSRDPLGLLVLVYEALEVGLVEEDAPADLDDPDLPVSLEAPETAKAYPEQAGRLPRREECHAFVPGAFSPKGKISSMTGIPVIFAIWRAVRLPILRLPLR